MHAEPSIDFDAMVTEILTPKRHERTRPAATCWTQRSTVDGPLGPIAVWTAGSGPTTFLVHGWEGSHDDLAAFVDPLLAKGRRAVALDLPAHGESFGTTGSLFDLAPAVAAVGEAFGPIDSVIAHSAGCPAVAMAIASGLVVGRAALIGSPLSYERFVRWYAQELQLSGDDLVTAFGRRGIDVTALDMRKTVASLTIPALIAHSADDRMTMASGSRALANAWPGSVLREVDGLGHSRILRDPETIAAIVAFVTSTGAV